MCNAQGGLFVLGIQNLRPTDGPGLGKMDQAKWGRETGLKSSTVGSIDDSLVITSMWIII